MRVVPESAVEFVDLPGRSSGDPLRARPTDSSLRLARPERTTQRRAHRHPHSEEVIFVRRGRGMVYIDGELHEIGPGDTIYIPRGAAHATIPAAAEAMELICFFPHPNLSENIEETDIDAMKEIDDE